MAAAPPLLISLIAIAVHAALQSLAKVIVHRTQRAEEICGVAGIGPHELPATTVFSQKPFISRDLTDVPLRLRRGAPSAVASSHGALSSGHAAANAPR